MPQRARNKALTLFLYIKTPTTRRSHREQAWHQTIHQPLMKISTLFRTAVLLTALIGTALTASAYDFVVDGI